MVRRRGRRRCNPVLLRLKDGIRAAAQAGAQQSTKPEHDRPVCATPGAGNDKAEEKVDAAHECLLGTNPVAGPGPSSTIMGGSLREHETRQRRQNAAPKWGCRSPDF